MPFLRGDNIWRLLPLRLLLTRGESPSLLIDVAEPLVTAGKGNKALGAHPGPRTGHGLRTSADARPASDGVLSALP
jgi:hypothetical protein